MHPSATLSHLLASTLECDGYQLTLAKSAKEADGIMWHHSIDLVVVDLDPSGERALKWCRRKRREGFCGMILVLTVQSDIAQRVAIIDAGADDLMTRPFAVAELRARVRAMARRYRGWTHTVLQHDGAEVDVSARRATRAGLTVSMTEREWVVLEYLSKTRGLIVPRARILQRIWGSTTKDTSNSLEVVISRIRHKLGYEWIRTVRNNGYVLDV